MGRAWRSPILSCFGLLLLLSAPLLAQQFGAIVGEVHVSKADLSGRVLVELQLHGSPINSEYTDEQGKFGFSPITNNVYHIVINDDRFYPVDQRVMVDLSVSAVTMVQIILMPRQAAANKSAPGVAAGTNPYLVDLAEYRRHFPRKAVKEFDKGVDAGKSGNVDSAIRHYERALQLAPGFYPAHNNLGSLYLSKKDFKDAEAQFRDAIRLEPSDSQGYLNLANVLSLTGRFPESEEAVKSGLQRNPTSAFGHFLQGDLADRSRNYPEAESDFQQALKLDPTMWQAGLQLANVYLQEGRRNDAVSQLQAFLKAFPAAPAAPRARQVLQQLQRPPKTAATH